VPTGRDKNPRCIISARGSGGKCCTVPMTIKLQEAFLYALFRDVWIQRLMIRSEKRLTLIMVICTSTWCQWKRITWSQPSISGIMVVIPWIIHLKAFTIDLVICYQSRVSIMEKMWGTFLCGIWWWRTHVVQSHGLYLFSLYFCHVNVQLCAVSAVAFSSSIAII